MTDFERLNSREIVWMIFKGGNVLAWLWVKSLQPDNTLAWLTGLAAARKSTGFLLCWFEKSGPSCGGLKIAIGAKEASGWNWWFSRQPLFRKHSARAVNKQPGFLHNLPNWVLQVFLQFHVYAYISLSCFLSEGTSNMSENEYQCPHGKGREGVFGKQRKPLQTLEDFHFPELTALLLCQASPPWWASSQDLWEPRISDRKRTKRWIRFIHGFAKSTYVCSACFYAILFFAQDMQYSFQRYVDWLQLQAYLL